MPFSEYKKYYTLFFLSLGIITLDQVTKSLIVKKFYLGESVSVIKNFFDLTLVHNFGAAFGMFSKLPSHIREPFFMIIPITILIVIFFTFRKLTDDKVYSVFGFSLIMSGAVGNLIDRFRFGYVVDFLDFHWFNKYHFAAFNVADSSICVGVFLLLACIVLKLESSEDEIQEE